MIFKKCLNSIKHLVSVRHKPHDYSPINRLSESAYKDLQKGINMNYENSIMIIGKRSLETIKALSALKLIRIIKIKTHNLSEKASDKINVIYYASFRTTQLGRELINKFCHYANQHQDCFTTWWPILMCTTFISLIIILSEIIWLLIGLITVMTIGITILIAFLCIYAILRWGDLRDYKRRTSLPTAKQLEKFLNISNKNKYIKYIVDIED